MKNIKSFVFGLLFLFIGQMVNAQFITTWNTTDTQITIPTTTGVYNYNIIWTNLTNAGVGDGSTTGEVGDFTIIGLANGDTYQVEITGTFPRIYFNNAGDKDKLLTVEQWGTNPWTSMEAAFWGCTNLTAPAIDAPDLTLVTSMKSMFRNASSYNSAMNTWNVSNVTDMQLMFTYANAFNQNIGGWNVSSVTNMATMFYGASSFSQDLSLWDVSNVTNMLGMFAASVFNGDISTWNVGSVTDMEGMFQNSPFNQNINSWDVSNVLNMNYMFGASGFNGNISTWNVGSVTDMAGMFLGSIFNQNINSWNVSNVTTMWQMFYNNTDFNQPLNLWTPTSVTTMKEMFLSAESFNQDISLWNVSNVINMQDMFRGAFIFNGIISNWNVSSVTDMSGMFAGSSFNQDISLWNVANVIDMGGMFAGSSFNQDISLWNVANVINMGGMFQNSPFNQNIGIWDVSSVVNMYGMFQNDTLFNQDLSTWNTGSVTTTALMFLNASAFDQSLGNWDISNVTNMYQMLNGSGLSTANYDQTLIGWDALPLLKNSVLLGASNLTFCLGATARANIISTYGWTITDSGSPCTEIGIFQGADNTGTAITDGQLADVDIGITVQSDNSDQIFAIENTGTEVLTISSITVGGGVFSIIGAPASVPSGATVNFTVRLNGFLIGTHNAIVTINNDDLDENPFTFPVIGEVIPLTVTNTLDDANVGSLRWAMGIANNVPGNSNINFNIPFTDPNYTLVGSDDKWIIKINSPLPILTGRTTFVGNQPGAGLQRIVIDGQKLYPILQVQFDETEYIVLNEIELRNGFNLQNGGAFHFESTGTSNILNLFNCKYTSNRTSGHGGAIAITNNATVRIRFSILESNVADSSGGAMYGAAGGLIEVLESSIKGNRADGGSGGGINNAGLHTITISKSSFTNNSATANGGALATASLSNSINNSTFANNSAINGGGIYLDGPTSVLTVTLSTIYNNTSTVGGGFFINNGSLNIGHTIIAGNSPFDFNDVSGFAISNGYNFVSLDPSSPFFPDVPSDSVGRPTFIDPMLGTVQIGSNGTSYFLPQIGSPVIDAGNYASVSSYSMDQLGILRNSGLEVDLGAVESPILPQIVTNTNDTGSGSLRSIINLANTMNGIVPIEFDIPNTDPNYSISGINETWTIRPAMALPTLTTDTKIDGNTQPGTGDQRVVLDGTNTLGLISSNREIEVLNVAFINSSSAGNGGAISTGYSVTIEDCYFKNNQSSTGGGAVYGGWGSSARQSSFENNTAPTGGAIWFSTGIIDSCTFNNNIATAGDGGAITALWGSIYVSHFENNSSTNRGGAVRFNNINYIDNSSFINNSADIGGAVAHTKGSFDDGYITNSTFYGNSARLAGAIYHYDTYDDGEGITIYSSTIVNTTTSAGTAIEGKFFYLSHTIIASTVGADIDPNGWVESYGYNFISLDAASDIIEDPTDQIGTVVALDPMLGSLMVSGNGTSYLSPLVGSPLIDAGNYTDLSETTDQIGQQRDLGGEADIGAVEYLNIGCTNPPTANAGPDRTWCEDNVRLLGSSFGGGATSIFWSTSGDGTFTDDTSLFSNYIPGTNDLASGTVIITLTTNDPDGAGPCLAASDDVVITIEKISLMDAGPDQTICQGDLVQLAGVIIGEPVDIYWYTSNADGTFDDGSSLAAIYTPGPKDILNGSFQLGLESSPPVCTEESDNITITISQPIIAVGQSASLYVLETTVIDVTNGATIGIGDVIATTLLTQPQKGTTVINADGSISYTALAGTVGDDIFDYEIRNQCDLFSTAQITITIINVPPVVNVPPSTIIVGGIVTRNILADITDDNDNIDLSTLKILVPPASGAAASLDASGNLIVDYAGLKFVGTDQLTIEICDLDSLCTSQVLFIDVEPPGVTVYNAVSPNGDGKHDYLEIENAEFFAGNQVKIMNRWGDIVYEIAGYNNDTKKFSGVANKNGSGELPSGTYYYNIVLGDGSKDLTGFFTLRR